MVGVARRTSGGCTRRQLACETDDGSARRARGGRATSRSRVRHRTGKWPTTASRIPGIAETTAPSGAVAFGLPANQARNGKKGCRKRGNVPWAEPPLRGALWRQGRDVSITPITSVVLRSGLPDAELPAECGRTLLQGRGTRRHGKARGTPASSQSFAKQAVFAHHYWLARR
jgi:hypothetical protein